MSHPNESFISIFTSGLLKCLCGCSLMKTYTDICTVEKNKPPFRQRLSLQYFFCVLSHAVLYWLQLLLCSRLACPGSQPWGGLCEGGTDVDQVHAIWRRVIMHSGVIINSLWGDLNVTFTVIYQPHVSLVCVEKREVKLSSPDWCLLYPEWLSGSWEILCYVSDEKVEITFIRCHTIRVKEKKRAMMDT